MTWSEMWTRLRLGLRSGSSGHASRPLVPFAVSINSVLAN
jgi:hypothetical protein